MNEFETKERRRIHGVWRSMIDRCSNEKNSSYKNYGGRGITVCDRWSSFSAFIQDMGPRTRARRSIDRIDNDGDYSPNNCRWASKKEQARNTRKNLRVTFNGQTLCVSEWAEVMGLNYSLLYQRISCGWSPERALTQGKGGKRFKK